MSDLMRIGIRNFILDKESDINREKCIKIPCIARHFKHELTNNYPDYIYVVIGICEIRDLNISSEEEKNLKRLYWAEDCNNPEAVYPIYEYNGQFYMNAYFNDLPKGSYVIYKSLYNNKTYIQEFNEFMSPVDKEKYPNIKQYWRFELD